MHIITEMVGCVAYGCTNRSEKGFHMKKFPKDPVRRKIWTAHVKRKEIGSQLMHHFFVNVISKKQCGKRPALMDQES